MSPKVNKVGHKKTQRDRKLSAAQRQRKALRLRAEGKSYEDVAKELGYAGRSGAWRSVQAALAKVRAEGVSELRALECERLDRLLEGCWSAATGKGRRAVDVKAINAVLRICERRARLLGLDAPTRLEIARLLESEDWQRVRDAIKGALEPWPDAASAVAEALRGIET